MQAALPLCNEHEGLAFNTIVGAILPGLSTESLQDLGSSSTQPATRFFLLDAPDGTGKTFTPT